MTVHEIQEFMSQIVGESNENRVPEGAALRPDLVSMQMYGGVLVGVGAADGGEWSAFRDRAVVGEHFMIPREWLPSASSVISVFFSLASSVIKSNAHDAHWPSDEWLHARYEGQRFIGYAMNQLKEEIERLGHRAVVPSSDDRFESVKAPEAGKCFGMSYTSNWSERHAAFACGLGTFGLSAGVITEKGTAGRFGSLVTSLDLRPTPHGYTEPFEYCTMCGACVRRCPVQAISKSEGKNHAVCSALINETKIKFPPRLGCGKCQTLVPCRTRIPGRK